MKILHISHSDISGGASKAALRLLNGVRGEGIEAEILVNQKSSDHYFVHGPETNISKALNTLRIPLDNLPKLLYPNRKNTIFHIQWLPGRNAGRIKKHDPDIVHLHWICRGFINIGTLSRIHRPIIWTLHDMWPFSGGCHYAGTCSGYKTHCGSCPQLGSKKNSDLSYRLLKWKEKHWNRLDLTVIAPSNWLAGCAKKSRLLHDMDIRVIPNGLDLDIYRPHDKLTARKLFGLSEDAFLVLFGALKSTRDERKGFHFLPDALNHVTSHEIDKKIELVVFGASEPAGPPALALKTNYMGYLNDDVSIALLLSACDIFVAPSMEDNLPNTIMEAMACGVPCAAFDTGGIPDMIAHKQNGYLARPYETNDLAMGIKWIIEDRERWERLSSNARAKVEKEFDIRLVAQQYIEVYRQAFLRRSVEK